MKDWRTYFMDLLPVIASKSPDPATQVGCIIVAPDNTIRSMGHNDMPKGVYGYVAQRYERPDKYLYFSHSEEAAICAAAKNGIPLSGCRLYMSWFPCAACARMMINAGIIELIYDATVKEKYGKTEKWGHEFEVATTMLQEAGVKITPYHKI